jgi:hypothetical protein
MLRRSLETCSLFSSSLSCYEDVGLQQVRLNHEYKDHDAGNIVLLISLFLVLSGRSSSLSFVSFNSSLQSLPEVLSSVCHGKLGFWSTVRTLLLTMPQVIRPDVLCSVSLLRRPRSQCPCRASGTEATPGDYFERCVLKRRVRVCGFHPNYDLISTSLISRPLDFHTVNVAQLQICGGIAGSIEKCQGSPTSTTGVSGNVQFSITPVIKGDTINISKGRWERTSRGLGPSIEQF